VRKIVDNEIYSAEDQKRDDELVEKLEKDYETETDPVLKAEKYVYSYYFYEARRMKLLAMYFNEGIKRDPNDLLDEEEYYIWTDAILSSGGDCSVCDLHNHYSEKMWVSEMEKKLGKEDWKETVKKTKEDWKKYD